MRHCGNPGFDCLLPRNVVCQKHGPAVRKGKPAFERNSLPPNGLHPLPLPGTRWKQILRLIDEEYERYSGGFGRKLDPWTKKLKKALDVDFEGRKTNEHG